MQLFVTNGPSPTEQSRSSTSILSRVSFFFQKSPYFVNGQVKQTGKSPDLVSLIKQTTHGLPSATHRPATTRPPQFSVGVVVHPCLATLQPVRPPPALHPHLAPTRSHISIVQHSVVWPWCERTYHTPGVVCHNSYSIGMIGMHRSQSQRKARLLPTYVYIHTRY